MAPAPFLGTETRDGWDEWLPSSHNVAAGADGLVIERERHPTYASPDPVVESPAGTSVRDVAIDDCGTLVLLASDGTLWTHAGRASDPRRLRCVGSEEERWTDPTALCVTENSIYVTDGPGRVFAVARTIRQLRWVVDGPFVSPTRVVAARRLDDSQRRETPPESEDRDGTAGTGGDEDSDAVYVLDTREGADDDPAVVRVAADGSTTTVVEGLTDPTDVAFDGRETLYVLDSVADDSSVVRAYDTRSTADGAGPESALFDELSDRNRSSSASLSCIAAMPTGDVVAGVASDSTAERTLYRSPATARTFEPVPAFKRPVTRLLFRVQRARRGADGDEDASATYERDLSSVRGLYALGGPTLAAADPDERTVFHLDVTRANRLDPITEQYGALAIHWFDAGERGVQWHRITTAVDTTDPGTQLRVHYYATDDDRARLLRGSSEWVSVDGPNPADALLDDAVGRYLWVALELVGGEFVSPRVSSFRAYFPRDTYLRHLPAVYREDAESRAFLERFLSIFESVFDGLEAEFAAVTRHLDAAGVPSEYISWLEEWLAVETGPLWPDAARREFLASAPAVFKARGTRLGLLTVLDLYLKHAAPAPPALSAAQRRELDRLDEEVESGALAAEDALRTKRRVLSHATVLEREDLSCLPDGEARDPYERLLDCSQCFFVLVRPHLSDDEFEAVRDIVESFRPAHTAGRAVRLQPWAELGGHAYLGVNTALPTRELVVGDATLGRDSVLDDREPHGQLNVRSRLGEDSLIS